MADSTEVLYLKGIITVLINAMGGEIALDSHDMMAAQHDTLEIYEVHDPWQLRAKVIKAS